jgi:hypothetical protein
VVSPNGAVVFVVGQSPGSTSGFDYVAMAYDACSGATVWSKRYNGSGNSAPERVEDLRDRMQHRISDQRD